MLFAQQPVTFVSVCRCCPELYLKPTLEHDGQLSASVRGRPIRGIVEQVPVGFKLVRANLVPASAEGGVECKRIEVKQSFSKFAIWNLSLPLDANCDLKKALTWLDVAKCVHATTVDPKPEVETDLKDSV